MSFQRISFALAASAAVLFLGWAIFFKPDPAQPTFSGEIMGTTYSVLVYGCEETTCEFLDEYVRTRLNSLNKIFSHYDPASELSQFNRNQSEDWIRVSEELHNVVAYGLAISKQSEGAFDITAAHAVNVWGFGPDEVDVPPPRELIDEALRRTSYLNLETQEKPASLRKLQPYVALDLSAIAKGYAVDQIAIALESFGFSNYMVEIGGEIRVGGTKPNGRAWRIGLETPEEMLDYSFVVTPQDEALATSGDYRNFFIVNGQRYAHTIDPRTARPVMHELASVSVIQPTAIQADALATLLMVLGPERGLEYAEHSELPALFWVRAEAGLAPITTTALQNYLPRD